MRFYKNTDTIDIGTKELGISNDMQLNDRGLKITIRHNGEKDLFDRACEIQDIITDVLNKYYKED